MGRRLVYHFDSSPRSPRHQPVVLSVSRQPTRYPGVANQYERRHADRLADDQPGRNLASGRLAHPCHPSAQRQRLGLFNARAF